MKSRVIVSAVIEKENNLLFGRKLRDTGPYPNTLHLIGGGINLEEESLLKAIEREIEEEAGIHVEIIEPLGFDEDYEPDKKGEMTHYLFLIFKAKYLSGELNPKDDIVKLEWIAKEKLASVHLNTPSIRLFRKMGYL